MEWLLEWWIQHHIFIAGALSPPPPTRGHLSWAGPRMMDNIIVLDDQNTMKITDWLMVWRTGFIGRLRSWDLFVLSLCLFLYLPIQPSTHPVIHPSRKSSSISALFWARSCFAELKIWRSQRFDFFFFLSLPPYLPEKQHRLYSLQLLSHLCPSSSFFLFSSSRLPPFRDLKITARHMTPLSSFSLSRSLSLSLSRRWRFKVLF